MPVRWACGTGVCHTCETGLIAGAVEYRSDPVEPPGDGNLLICCSQPQGDIVPISRAKAKSAVSLRGRPPFQVDSEAMLRS